MKTTLITTITDQAITIPSNEEVTIVALLTKGWDSTRTIDFNFEGENSTLNFFAFIIGKNQEKFSFKTNSNHSAKGTNSAFTVRSVLYDQSEIDYTGALNIKPDISKIDTRLAHHTLLLSKDAKITTTPSLEIESNDVKASHAATIGHVDEDMLFYIQSRGLEKQTATNLLIQGFLLKDLPQINDEKIRETITKALLSK